MQLFHQSEYDLAAPYSSGTKESISGVEAGCSEEQREQNDLAERSRPLAVKEIRFNTNAMIETTTRRIKLVA